MTTSICMSLHIYTLCNSVSYYIGAGLQRVYLCKDIQVLVVIGDCSNVTTHRVTKSIYMQRHTNTGGHW
jgi:hypothetical protein